ncbi:HypC/HybG/HupF family hydrogenase formation chaperone [Nocardioides hungaricus]
MPSRIVAVAGHGVLARATLDAQGATRECHLAYLPEARVGDWVLVQAGFAVTLLDEESARESLAAFAELGVLGRAEADGSGPCTSSP